MGCQTSDSPYFVGRGHDPADPVKSTDHGIQPAYIHSNDRAKEIRCVGGVMTPPYDYCISSAAMANRVCGVTLAPESMME